MDSSPVDVSPSRHSGGLTSGCSRRRGVHAERAAAEPRTLGRIRIHRMDQPRLPVLGIILAMAVLTGGRPVAQDWERANSEIVRLKPGAFENLAPAVRGDLERRGCLVPQTYLNGAPHNIVRGRFTSVKQFDIAVLCSISGVSSILVYPPEALVGVREVARRPDRDYLQVVDVGGVIGFSRSLNVASPQYIRRQHERYGRPQPPALEHDGIDDGFLEKASVVWYWYQERWLRLQGAD